MALFRREAILGRSGGSILAQGPDKRVQRRDCFSPLSTDRQHTPTHPPPSIHLSPDPRRCRISVSLRPLYAHSDQSQSSSNAIAKATYHLDAGVFCTAFTALRASSATSGRCSRTDESAKSPSRRTVDAPSRSGGRVLGWDVGEYLPSSSRSSILPDTGVTRARPTIWSHIPPPYLPVCGPATEIISSLDRRSCSATCPTQSSSSLPSTSTLVAASPSPAEHV
ncbi:hypothetical protein C8F01DRAFT_208493 [Mycena amicta]|nr:hypothetical protein C8F01DRAFT_208493 [Mycena amicta]